MGLRSHTQISDRAITTDPAVAEACTGRAAIGTGNLTRPATVSQGGAA